MAKESAVEKKLLHYTGKAIADFNMIQSGDRILVCLSGGKDSFTMVRMLTMLQNMEYFHRLNQLHQEN